LIINYGLFLAVFVVGCSGEDPVSTGVRDFAAKMTVSALAGGGKELLAGEVR